MGDKKYLNITDWTEDQRLAYFLKIVHERLKDDTKCSMKQLCTKFGINEIVPALMVEKKILMRLGTYEFRWMSKDPNLAMAIALLEQVDKFKWQPNMSEDAIQTLDPTNRIFRFLLEIYNQAMDDGLIAVWPQRDRFRLVTDAVHTIVDMGIIKRKESETEDDPEGKYEWCLAHPPDHNLADKVRIEMNERVAKRKNHSRNNFIDNDIIISDFDNALKNAINPPLPGVGDIKTTKNQTTMEFQTREPQTTDQEQRVYEFLIDIHKQMKKSMLVGLQKMCAKYKISTEFSRTVIAIGAVRRIDRRNVQWIGRDPDMEMAKELVKKNSELVKERNANARDEKKLKNAPVTDRIYTMLNEVYQDLQNDSHSPLATLCHKYKMAGDIPVCMQELGIVLKLEDKGMGHYKWLPETPPTTQMAEAIKECSNIKQQNRQKNKNLHEQAIEKPREELHDEKQPTQPAQLIHIPEKQEEMNIDEVETAPPIQQNLYDMRKIVPKQKKVRKTKFKLLWGLLSFERDKLDE